jgi:hypothetical protein
LLPRTLLERALLLIDEKLMQIHGDKYFPSYGWFLLGPPDSEEIPLGALVKALVNFELLPQDIQEYTGPLRSRSVK